MAKMTLLEMTQDILNDMDSNPVNSIDDTDESLQIAQIIKTTYYNIVAIRDWPFLRALTAMTALADVTNPTKMQIPATVDKVFWMRYNKKRVYWMEPYAFKVMIDDRNTAASNIDANGYQTDKNPTYYTSYDDDFVFMDSYDSSVDTTLQASKSVIYAQTIPAWGGTDSSIATMPAKFFPTFLAAAKGTCFLTLKQVVSEKSEAIAGRGLVTMQNEAWRINEAELGSSTVDFGRTPGGRSTSRITL